MRCLVVLPFLLGSVVIGSEIVRRTSFSVPTTSMEPTVFRGEHVIVNELAYRKTAPARGDIVAYRLTTNPEATLLKRIVGLPFETIQIKQKQLYINGQRMGESYVVHRDSADYSGTNKPEPFRSRDRFGPLKLAMDQYFVLGDNRDQSMDSRYHGPIRRAQIRGKVERVVGATRFRELP